MKISLQHVRNHYSTFGKWASLAFLIGITFSVGARADDDSLRNATRASKQFTFSHQDLGSPSLFNLNFENEKSHVTIVRTDDPNVLIHASVEYDLHSTKEPEMNASVFLDLQTIEFKSEEENSAEWTITIGPYDVWHPMECRRRCNNNGSGVRWAALDRH